MCITMTSTTSSMEDNISLFCFYPLDFFSYNRGKYSSPSLLFLVYNVLLAACCRGRCSLVQIAKESEKLLRFAREGGWRRSR